MLKLRRREESLANSARTSRIFNPPHAPELATYPALRLHRSYPHSAVMSWGDSRRTAPM